jgi:hypothetical protein
MSLELLLAKRLVSWSPSPGGRAREENRAGVDRFSLAASIPFNGEGPGPLLAISQKKIPGPITNRSGDFPILSTQDLGHDHLSTAVMHSAIMAGLLTSGLTLPRAFPSNPAELDKNL